jgi:acyl-CoA reductase-like NAD-dependent aldehyde dehydrogenase
MSAAVAFNGLEQVAAYLDKVTAALSARHEQEAQIMGDEYEEIPLSKGEVEGLIRNLAEAADSIRTFSTAIRAGG